MVWGINRKGNNMNDWRSGLKQLEQHKKHIEQDGMIMTPLERKQANEVLETLLRVNIGRSSNGIEAEVLDAAEAVKRRERVLKSYKQKEAEEWDAAKQAIAYTGIENRLREAAGADGMTGGQGFEEIYKDAQNSKYALLAFSELAPKYARDASDPQLNSLAVRAGRMVRELRNTEDIKARQAEYDQAVNALGEKLQEAGRVHEVLYNARLGDPLYPNSLSRTVKRITTNENGSIEILPADHPSVTGVSVGGEFLNDTAG